MTTHGTVWTTRGACGVECARRAVGGGSSTAGVALVTEYEHEASEGRRAGGARAFGVDVDEGTGEVMIRELGAFDGDASGSSIGAVFEARWSAREGDDERCAFVDADGFLTLARAEETYGEGGGANARGITFHALDKVHCGGGGLGMATCLDWRADGTLAVSAADGSFRVVREETSSVEVVDAIEGAHDLEMWAVAFDLARADVLYTGADDCAFKVWDLRAASRATVVNRKTHGAGETCVSPSPHDDTIVAMGSCDDHLRLWDVRALKSPVSELNIGGGVWRCRWDPTRHAFPCAAMDMLPRGNTWQVVLPLPQPMNSLRHRIPRRGERRRRRGETGIEEEYEHWVRRCWSAVPAERPLAAEVRGGLGRVADRLTQRTAEDGSPVRHV